MAMGDLAGHPGLDQSGLPENMVDLGMLNDQGLQQQQAQMYLQQMG